MSDLVWIEFNLPGGSNVIRANNNTLHREKGDNDLLYGYSGKHDHGLCTTLSRGGHYSNVLDGLQRIKGQCDCYLTEEIKKEACASSQANKRVKVDG